MVSPDPGYGLPLAAGADATAMESALVAACEAASVARTVKLNVPDWLGVPESAPLVASVTPGGSAPEETLNLYGVVPPEALTIAEYALPTVPEPTLDVMMVSGAGAGDATAIDSVLVAVCEAASATRTVKVDVPDWVGVPERAPLVVSAIPGGNEPEARLKL